MSVRRAQLIPAVLAYTARDFARRLVIARRLSNVIHLDVMDGRFVRTRSVGRSVIARLPRGPRYQLHLMVHHPAAWLAAVHQARIKDVIIHVEARGALEALAEARRRGVRTRIAFNPGTTMTRISRFVPLCDGLHCLGVRPGQYGARFQARTLRTVRAIRRRWPALPVSFDGGVRTNLLRSLMRLGVRELVVGSAVFLTPDPVRSFRALQRFLASGVLY